VSAPGSLIGQMDGVQLPGLLRLSGFDFGYSGYYVGLGDYQYYFREGFRRGYEDGYYGRWQYGSYSNGVFSLLSGVLRESWICGLLSLDNGYSQNARPR